MHEFRYYAVWDEALAIVRDVAEKHALKLTPEIPQLPEPRIKTYERFVPEVAEKLAKFPMLLLSGDFTTHPLEFRRREAGTAAGTYYVNTMRGGPVLIWALPGVNTTGRPTLAPGSISYIEHVFDPVTGKPAPASASLKEAFKKVVATIKQHVLKVAITRNQKVWVGKKSKELLEEKQVFIDV